MRRRVLQHGLKEMAGRKIRLPRRVPDRPNQEFLEERFTEFRAA